MCYTSQAAWGDVVWDMSTEPQAAGYCNPVNAKEQGNFML